MKLFTIGDSISQGFMSAAAARTDLSYSTLLAAKLGAKPGTEYRYPEWPAGGIPVNLEEILRSLNRRYGSNISGFEWLTVLHSINEVVDRGEDHYERGPGRPDRPYPGGVKFFHNVAVRGLDVADAWLLTPALCRKEIQLEESRGLLPDGFLAGASAAFYRTALKVLNPSLAKKYDDHSALTWLKEHATGEGIENTVLWLGANNALGTVLHLKIRQTPNVPTDRPHLLGHLERARLRKWNLWHPDDFAAEYRELLKRTDAILRLNTFPGWKAFLGTVPLVTIAPLAKGVGPTTDIAGKGIYFKYYTYFPFEEEFAHKTGIHLTMQDALHIDDCIRAYNRTIKGLADELNQQHGQTRYLIVDIAEALNRIAYKRNAGQPTYNFPPFFNFIYPEVNTKYYHADAEGRLRQGGLFSLDGIHPTAIGQGLIAWEFLKEMQSAGVVADSELDWATIFANDLLYAKPISLMHEFYGKDDLVRHVLKLIQLFRD